jgi:hypothetical protein
LYPAIPFGFVVAGRKSTVYLSAANADEQQSWVEKLKSSIEESVENARALEGLSSSCKRRADQLAW